MSQQARERWIVFLVGAVQFVNVTDFVLVMPLGPELSRGIGIATSDLALVGASYTAAAAVTGFAGAFFLDRFDRRTALVVAMLGLTAGTAAGALAVDLPTLLAARLVAGAFGGPATSVAYSIIADIIPPARRGKAVGAVMGAVAAASVLGVPLALELARLAGWQSAFLGVAAAALAVTLGAAKALPSMRGHLTEGAAPAPPPLSALLADPSVRLSYTMTAAMMSAGFAVIPNIAAYVQANLGFEPSKMGLLYLCGGLVTFGTTRAGGALVDRYGAFRVGTAGCALFSLVVYLGFVTPPESRPVLLGFCLFMLALGLRNVAINTLTSRVPSASQRARFMSLQSSVQHIASSIGAFASSRLLATSAEGPLVGVERVAHLSIGLTAVIVPLLLLVERRVTAREGAGMPAPRPAEPARLAD